MAGLLGEAGGGWARRGEWRLQAEEGWVRGWGACLQAEAALGREDLRAVGGRHSHLGARPAARVRTTGSAPGRIPGQWPGPDPPAPSPEAAAAARVDSTGPYPGSNTGAKTGAKTGSKTGPSPVSFVPGSRGQIPRPTGAGRGPARRASSPPHGPSKRRGRLSLRAGPRGAPQPRAPGPFRPPHPKGFRGREGARRPRA